MITIEDSRRLLKLRERIETNERILADLAKQSSPDRYIDVRAPLAGPVDSFYETTIIPISLRVPALMGAVRATTDADTLKVIVSMKINTVVIFYKGGK